MLPTPVSFIPRRSSGRNGPFTRPRVLDVLLTRARATNLAVLLLASCTFFSLVLNLHHYLSRPTSSSGFRAGRLPLGVSSTLARKPALTELDHLIIVAGHAIWTGTNPERRLDENEWLLEPYQRGGGRVAAFYAHIAHGAELAMRDERSLLVFSGGQTRGTSTTSEAESYFRLAISSNLLSTHASSEHTPLFLRATTEDHSLDSLQNLVFSIARFREYSGRYPQKITVVGYEMKRRRFTELHRAAIRWPANRFQYIGVDPEGEHGGVAQEGEMQNGYLPFTSDLYGCHDFLLAKRRRRNPHLRVHSYYTSSPELGDLLDWCPDVVGSGKIALYPGPLPWDGR